MIPRRILRAILAATAVVVLGGCALVPASGPADYDINAGVSPTIPYALVKLTPETVSTLAHYEPRGLAGVFPDKQLPPTKI